MSIGHYPGHQILTGDAGPGDPLHSSWLHELKQLAAATGCYAVLFPEDAKDVSDAEIIARCQDGTHQNLALQLQTETASKLVTEYISGRVWAYMLALSSDPDVLSMAPDEAVRWAMEAAQRMAMVPRSERELHRLRFELSNGSPDDYPTQEHYEDGRAWLEVVCRKSARYQNRRWRQSHPGQRTPSPIRRPSVVPRVALGFPIWDDAAMDVDRPDVAERERKRRADEEPGSPRRSSRRVKR